jgi:TRAP-type mannitol/chloroaromatic compound transport system permease small subunit
MRNIISNINKLSQWSGEIVSWLIVIMVILPTFEAVLMRYILNTPTIWSQELTTFVFGCYFVLGGAYCLKEKGHVAMDIFYNRLNPRGRGIIGILIFLCILLLCGTMVIHGTSWAWKATITGERSETFWHPIIWPVRWAIPIGSGLLLLQAFSNFIIDIKMVITGEEAKNE